MCPTSHSQKFGGGMEDQDLKPDSENAVEDSQTLQSAYENVSVL